MATETTDSSKQEPHVLFTGINNKQTRLHPSPDVEAVQLSPAESGES